MRQSRLQKVDRSNDRNDAKAQTPRATAEAAESAASDERAEAEGLDCDAEVLDWETDGSYLGGGDPHLATLLAGLTARAAEDEDAGAGGRAPGAE